MHKLMLAAVFILGFACIVASVMSTWFAIPTLVEVSGTQQIVAVDSPITVVFRTITALVTLTIVAIWWMRPDRRQWATGVAAFGLVVLLLFPHCQMVWQPTITSQAAWLQIQHENLTWFGGDIFRGQELEGTPAQIQLYLSDSPRQVSVLKLPNWTLSNFGLELLPIVCEGLGYTNTFCQFASVGWPLAVGGLTCLLLVTTFQNQRLSVPRIRIAVQTIACCGVLGGVSAGDAPFVASLRVQQAANTTHRGDHLKALEQLNAAADVWPPLKEDTWFVAQTGLLESLAGIESASARLHEARSLEDAKQFDPAVHAYREIASTYGNSIAVRREATRGILRYAIRALNSGEIAKSLAGFEDVLTLEPCNIKSLYGLQVAYRWTAQDAASKAIHRRFANVYAHLHFPNKEIVVQKSRALCDRPQLFGLSESADVLIPSQLTELRSNRSPKPARSQNN